MRRVILCCAVVALATAAAAGGASAAKAPTPKKQVSRALALLIDDTRLLPKRAVKKRHRAALVRTAKRARRQARRRPCRAIRTLRAYRRQLKRVKTRRTRNRARRPTSGSPRGALQARLANLHAALLQMPAAKRCGGGRRSRVTEAKATVLASSERRLRLRVQLPPPRFVQHQAAGRSYLELAMEGLDVTGDVGEPGLPARTTYFGIPEGANVDLKIGRVQGYTIPGVELYPLQREPVDIRLPPGAPPIETFADKPFVLDRAAYRSRRGFPRRPADAGPLGTMRDLRVGGVSVSGGQYRPARDRLRVFTSIDVTIDFKGANKGLFGPSTLLDPWNKAFVDDYAALVNLPDVLERLRPERLPFCGEELLIVTSSDLRPAADTLASQRRAQGYVTSVKEVGSGPGQIGTTNTQIQAYIRSRLNGDCLLIPSYVILFGNTAHVPTFLVPCSPGGDPDACNIASDLDYSLDGVGGDLFADVQLGRLPAPDLAGANALVAKLNAYATTSPAPAGDDFFSRATVTSYFEPPQICVLNEGQTGTPNCDGNNPPVTGHWAINYPANTDTRGFTLTAERVRKGIRADGYGAERLYTTDNEDVIPLYYWNGTPIPDELRRPAFAWDANTTDFLNAYNEGRFVILHRDHGWHGGWGDPTLHSGHVPLFTNGTQQPVVFGIDCSSAQFDIPGNPSFVERQILRPDGGAIAGFGDTRESPTWANNHMAIGFFDAMFPLTVPDYGGPETRRLGDILIRGKQYMATQEGMPGHGSGQTYVEHYLYHLLGDPTMQMWSDPPVRFDPNRFRGVIRDIREKFPPEPGDPPFFVRVELVSQLAEGTVVTLFSGSQAIGRAIVHNGVADIVPEVDGDQRDLSISLQQEGALPASEPIENPPPKQQTSLSFDDPGSPSKTDNPNPFSGKLAPALAGAKVRVRYTPDDPANPTGVVEHTVGTDAQGVWRDQVNFVFHSPSGWTAQAFFDGDGAHAASASNVVQFDVGD